MSKPIVEPLLLLFLNVIAAQLYLTNRVALLICPASNFPPLSHFSTPSILTKPTHPLPVPTSPRSCNDPATHSQNAPSPPSPLLLKFLEKTQGGPVQVETQEGREKSDKIKANHAQQWATVLRQVGRPLLGTVI